MVFNEKTIKLLYFERGIKMENADVIMLNDEVVEAAEEIATISFREGLKVAADIGWIVLGGVFTYKYVIKPIIAKIKDKREQKIEVINSAEDDFDDVNDVESDETEE